MVRLALALVMLLPAAVVAAPVPRIFEAGWDMPLDPDSDCKFIRGGDSLTIELPGTDHDYDRLRGVFNVPRLLREIEGDFVMQVRVRVEGHPSAKSTVEGQPSSVSAGFLMILPEQASHRLVYGLSLQGQEAEDYAAVKTRWAAGGQTNAVWNPHWKNWPLAAKAEQAYLRLERRGKWLRPSLSPDGRKWTPLNGALFEEERPKRLQVGLAAFTSSAEPCKVHFDKFQLNQPQKKRK